METLDTLLVVWMVATGASALFVAGDILFRTPSLNVMKPGWILVTLYMGPVGLAIYLATCRPPHPGRAAHDEYIRPIWRQAAGSAVHCVAGDATGVIVAATFVALLRGSGEARLEIPSGVDVMLEYTLGFLFGLFIFQALFMKAMLGGYWQAVRKTILPEWLSMNLVMAGMIPVMVLGMQHIAGADHPTSLRYWGVMQVAAIVGYATGYPINYWMVSRGIKHGMMTQPAGAMASMHGSGMQHDPPAGDGQMPDHGDMSAPAGHVQHADGVGTDTLIVATLVSLAGLAAGIAIAATFGRLEF